jgi:subtilase family serine protease
MIFVLSVLLAAALLQLPASLSSILSKKAKFHKFPSLFEIIGKADSAVHHELIFAIKQLNVDTLNNLLLSVSNISSPYYGHYLSRDEVASYTSNPSAVQSVTNYLLSRGIANFRTTKYGEFIIATAPLYIWEVLFETVFYKVGDKIDKKRWRGSGQQSALRGLQYTIPRELDPHLHAVFNIIETPPFSRLSNAISGEAISKRKLAAALAELLPADKMINNKLKAYVTGFTYPNLINHYYNVSSNRGSNLTSQAVFETSGQMFSSVDMEIFENSFDLPIAQPTTDINDHIIATACKGIKNCAEANLDVQYLMAVAQDTPTT